MPKAKINGVNIYYESHGQGFPLVCAYGLGGSTAQWEYQIPAFSSRYRFIVWDPRGHGRSDSPSQADEYGQDISVQDLKGLLDHLDIEQAYIGGLSMGGGIATRFTVTYPRRAAALLILDSSTAAGRGTTPEARRMREEIIRLAETEGMEAAGEYSMKNNPNITSSPVTGNAQQERLRRMYLSLNPVGYAHSVRMLLNSVFDSSLLHGIDTPCLVLAGDNDPALADCRFIHENIRGSQLVVIPKAGHLSNWDQPEAFNNAVLEFLAKVDAAREVKKSTGALPIGDG